MLVEEEMVHHFSRFLPFMGKRQKTFICGYLLTVVFFSSKNYFETLIKLLDINDFDCQF